MLTKKIFKSSYVKDELFKEIPDVYIDRFHPSSGSISNLLSAIRTQATININHVSILLASSRGEICLRFSSAPRLW